MHTCRFTQYILGFVIFTASSFALSDTEFTYNVIGDGIEITGCAGTCPSDLVILTLLMVIALPALGKMLSEKTN